MTCFNFRRILAIVTAPARIVARRIVNKGLDALCSLVEPRLGDEIDFSVDLEPRDVRTSDAAWTQPLPARVQAPVAALPIMAATKETAVPTFVMNGGDGPKLIGDNMAADVGRIEALLADEPPLQDEGFPESDSVLIEEGEVIQDSRFSCGSCGRDQFGRNMRAPLINSRAGIPTHDEVIGVARCWRCSHSFEGWGWLAGVARYADEARFTEAERTKTQAEKRAATIRTRINDGRFERAAHTLSAARKEFPYYDWDAVESELAQAKAAIAEASERQDKIAAIQSALQQAVECDDIAALDRLIAQGKALDPSIDWGSCAFGSMDQAPANSQAAA